MPSTVHHLDGGRSPYMNRNLLSMECKHSKPSIFYSCTAHFSTKIVPLDKKHARTRPFYLALWAFENIFRHPSLSSKGKILYRHLFSLSRHLRTSFKVLACSLISRYSSIFKAFSMVLSKRKRPHRMVFPLFKVFGLSLFYSFPRLKIFTPWG